MTRDEAVKTLHKEEVISKLSNAANVIEFALENAGTIDLAPILSALEIAIGYVSEMDEKFQQELDNIDKMPPFPFITIHLIDSGIAKTVNFSHVLSFSPLIGKTGCNVEYLKSGEYQWDHVRETEAEIVALLRELPLSTGDGAAAVSSLPTNGDESGKNSAPPSSP